MQATLSHPPIEIFQLQGHLNASNASGLQSQLTAAVSSSRNFALLVDMSHVESVDSAGLMVLVSALSLAQRQNRQLCLCSVSPTVRIIFELTQLDRVFKIYENYDAFMATLPLLAA